MANPSMEVKIDSMEIQRLLRPKKYFLMNGKIKKLCAIGKFIIFVYEFYKHTPCSDATSGDFAGADFPDDLINIDWSNLNINQNLAWSFFSLSKPRLQCE